MDVGRQLGNYILIRLLGQGGFADVYLGQHKILQTYAAIKVMNAHLSPTELQDFVREARTIANLKHPAIVRILDFDVADNNTPFLVMDHAPHGTLRQRHPEGSQIPLATVVSYVQQVAVALQYAHDHKLIHRDVKPENILIGSNHEIVLSDFGIAVVAHSTRSRKVEDIIGTWTYAAPELFLGTPRPATDQYALAIVAYEWLCGTPPFQGDFPALYHQHMNVPVPSLRQKLPKLPPAVEQVLLTALAKDPHQRYTSVQAFANALEAASQPPPPPPMPSPPTAPVVQHISPVPMNAPAQARKMVRCTRCGASINANSIFCNICGTQLAASVPETVRVPPTPLPLPSPGTTLLTYGGHSEAVNAVAWSPDGSLLASASDVRNDKTVQVWEANTGKLRQTYGGHSNSVLDVAWSPDGRLLASASHDKTVQVWEASSGKLRQTYGGHSDSDYVRAVAWSPDGSLLASASNVRNDKTVQVWEASSGKLRQTYSDHGYGVNAVAWSPDGRLLVSADGGDVMVWEASNGKLRRIYGSHSSIVLDVAWSPDGRLLASASYDKTVEVWEASTGKQWLTYRVHSSKLRLTYGGHSDRVNAVAWSPDGRLLASASHDKTVQVWEASTGKLRQTYGGHSDVVRAVAWSPDGRLLASASDDKTVQVWQAV